MEKIYTNTQVHDDVKLKCEECPESFNRNFSLTLHRTVVHEKLKTLQCKESGIVYNLQNDLRTPKTKPSNLKVNREKIPEIGKKYTSKSLATKRIQCTECNKFYKSNKIFKRHFKVIHEKQKSFQCEKCEKSFRDNSYPLTHVAIIHGGLLKFKCDVCQKLFGTKQFLDKHLEGVHGGTNFRYECDICQKSFGEKWTLKGHMAQIHSVGGVQCNICGKSFAQKSYLKIVLRPSEKFSSSSKTSKWIFEPSEFRARFLAFNFRAEQVRAKIFRAFKNSEQNPSQHEQFFERKFRAFFAKSSEQKYFFRAHLKFFPKIIPISQYKPSFAYIKVKSHKK